MKKQQYDSSHDSSEESDDYNSEDNNDNDRTNNGNDGSSNNNNNKHQLQHPVKSAKKSKKKDDEGKEGKTKKASKAKDSQDGAAASNAQKPPRKRNPQTTKKKEKAPEGFRFPEHFHAENALPDGYEREASNTWVGVPDYIGPLAKLGPAPSDLRSHNCMLLHKAYNIVKSMMQNQPDFQLSSDAMDTTDDGEKDVGLDAIKKRLESNGYETVEEVEEDVQGFWKSLLDSNSVKAQAMMEATTKSFAPLIALKYEPQFSPGSKLKEYELVDCTIVDQEMKFVSPLCCTVPGVRVIGNLQGEQGKPSELPVVLESVSEIKYTEKPGSIVSGEALLWVKAECGWFRIGRCALLYKQHLRDAARVVHITQVLLDAVVSSKDAEPMTYDALISKICVSNEEAEKQKALQQQQQLQIQQQLQLYHQQQHHGSASSSPTAGGSVATAAGGATGGTGGVGGSSKKPAIVVKRRLPITEMELVEHSEYIGNQLFMLAPYYPVFAELANGLQSRSVSLMQKEANIDDRGIERIARRAVDFVVVQLEKVAAETERIREQQEREHAKELNQAMNDLLRRVELNAVSEAFPFADPKAALHLSSKPPPAAQTEPKRGDITAICMMVASFLSSFDDIIKSPYPTADELHQSLLSPHPPHELLMLHVTLVKFLVPRDWGQLDTLTWQELLRKLIVTQREQDSDLELAEVLKEKHYWELCIEEKAQLLEWLIHALFDLIPAVRDTVEEIMDRSDKASTNIMNQYELKTKDIDPSVRDKERADLVNGIHLRFDHVVRGGLLGYDRFGSHYYWMGPFDGRIAIITMKKDAESGLEREQIGYYDSSEQVNGLIEWLQPEVLESEALLLQSIDALRIVIDSAFSLRKEGRVPAFRPPTVNSRDPAAFCLEQLHRLLVNLAAQIPQCFRNRSIDPLLNQFQPISDADVASQFDSIFDSLREALISVDDSLPIFMVSRDWVNRRVAWLETAQSATTIPQLALLAHELSECGLDRIRLFSNRIVTDRTAWMKSRDTSHMKILPYIPHEGHHVAYFRTGHLEQLQDYQRMPWDLVLPSSSSPEGSDGDVQMAEATAAATVVESSKNKEKDSSNSNDVVMAEAQEHNFLRMCVENIVYFQGNDKEAPFCRLGLGKLDAQDHSDNNNNNNNKKHKNNNNSSADDDGGSLLFVTLRLNPTVSSDFIVPLGRYEAAKSRKWAKGMKVEMYCPDEIGGSCCSGTVLQAPSFGENEGEDPWKSLKVKWTDAKKKEQQLVNPWEVDREDDEFATWLHPRNLGDNDQQTVVIVHPFVVAEMVENAGGVEQVEKNNEWDNVAKQIVSNDQVHLNAADANVKETLKKMCLAVTQQYIATHKRDNAADSGTVNSDSKKQRK